MKNNKLLLAMALGAPLMVANADWQLLNEFNSADDLNSLWQAPNIIGSGAHAEIEDGMLKLVHGDLFEQTSNLWAAVNLGVDLKQASIDAGTYVTLYFEVIQPTVDGAKAIIDTVWGLSNEDPATIPSVRYDSYNYMQRVGVTNDTLDSRNGSNGYVTHDKLEADAVHKFKIYVDYNSSVYSCQLEGGTWTEPTYLTWDNSGTADSSFGFRSAPGDDQTVDYFLFALSRGNSVSGEKGQDYTYIDNLYMDASGINATVPTTTANSDDMDFVVSECDSAEGIVTEYSYIMDSGSVSYVCAMDEGFQDSWLGSVDAEYMFSADSGYIFQENIGWLWSYEGATSDTAFFYSYDSSNYIWTCEAYEGWYWDYATSTWLDMTPVE